MGKKITGRPSKYDSKYCQQAIDYMSQGFSTKAFAGHIGVSLSTVYLWKEEHEDFSEALKAAQAAGACWWEDKLRQIASGGEGNASAAIFGVKNRSQEEWKDRRDLDHTSSDGSMTPQVIERVIVNAED